FRHVDELTVGSVGTTVGISATGSIDLSTNSGDLIVDEIIATTDSTASAITLNAGRLASAGTATGGNVLLAASDALSVGAGGRATIYTGSIEHSVGVSDAAGSAHFRYGSDETTTNYTAALGTGTYAIYREQPTLQFVVGGATGQYGDTPNVSSVGNTVVSGYLGNDELHDAVSGTYTTTATA